MQKPDLLTGLCTYPHSTRTAETKVPATH